MSGAALIKWLPSSFNYSCVQTDASAFWGVFGAIIAGFIVGGGTVLGLTFYRIVIGREYDRLSMFRPFPSILYGGVFAFVAGLICVLLIALVYTPDSLLQIGWTNSAERLPVGLLFRELFVTNRSGYAFPVTCVGLGVGMAMMTNSLRASTAWPEFLREQTAVTSLKQGIQVTRGIVRLSLPYAWPIVVLTPLFATIGLAIMQGSAPKAWHLTSNSVREVFFWGMDEPMSLGNDKIQLDPGKTPARIARWKTSLEGRVLGLFGDVLSKVVGGYFAIVGIGIGIVMLRHGVRVEPRGIQA